MIYVVNIKERDDMDKPKVYLTGHISVLVWAFIISMCFFRWQGVREPTFISFYTIERISFYLAVLLLFWRMHIKGKILERAEHLFLEAKSFFDLCLKMLFHRSLEKALFFFSGVGFIYARVDFSAETLCPLWYFLLMCFLTIALPFLSVASLRKRWDVVQDESRGN